MMNKIDIPDKGKRKRVVIVGGGFGGLKLARKLKNDNFQIVLLDKNNYHLFQPLLYQVATAGIESLFLSARFLKSVNIFIFVSVKPNGLFRNEIYWKLPLELLNTTIW